MFSSSILTCAFDVPSTLDNFRDRVCFYESAKGIRFTIRLNFSDASGCLYIDLFLEQVFKVNRNPRLIEDAGILDGPKFIRMYGFSFLSAARPRSFSLCCWVISHIGLAAIPNRKISYHLRSICITTVFLSKRTPNGLGFTIRLIRAF